uniref:UMOD/GP2/OIT3-like D8C domain-containing protein n=1 Tax=Astyanax mexicanus TaxID=7994 RepID=A0A3B1IS97_ASTMX
MVKLTECVFSTAGNVTSTMFDPCDNYNVLDEYWRSTKRYDTGHDDTIVEWNGWYRLFLQGASAQMPECCVGVYRCGTYYTLWLNGPHPQIEDGVVTRQVCGNAGYDCYYYRTTTIQVKACPGNYYVYELIRPDYCNMAYCTGIHIKKNLSEILPLCSLC